MKNKLNRLNKTKNLVNDGITEFDVVSTLHCPKKHMEHFSISISAKTKTTNNFYIFLS